MFLLLAFAGILTATAAAPLLPEGRALTTAIVKRDIDLFTVFFSACAPERFRSFLADDVEMYHDREGVVATSADEFVSAYRRNCESRTPNGWRTRRVLVRESLGVHPVPGFGAIEEGEHLFYERKGDGPERLTGRARFVHLWRLTEDGWKLSRVFSHAHEPAGEGQVMPDDGAPTPATAHSKIDAAISPALVLD